MYLINGYKKSVETCRAHHKVGIAKHHNRNEPRNKYPTLSYIPCEVQRGLYTGYTNRMSVALFSSLCCFEIGDFTLWDKSKKRILDPRISPLRQCKGTY